MPQGTPAHRAPASRRNGLVPACSTRIRWRPLALVLALPWAVACATPTVNRPELVVDPWQPVCAPHAALESIASAPDGERFYYLTVGVLQLEPGTPDDDVGIPDYFVSVRRRDAVIEERIEDAEDRRRRFAAELRDLERRIAAIASDGDDDAASREAVSDDFPLPFGIQRGTTPAQDDGGNAAADAAPTTESDEDRQARERLLAALNEKRNDARREHEAARARETRLRRLVSAETPILSQPGTTISFRDLPIPFRIYQGDTIEVAVIEHDPFANDRLGDTSFVVDAQMLETGLLDLTTGWVQSLSLGFVRCDAQLDVR